MATSGGGPTPIYEGDTILFTALEAGGFVFSLPCSSSFSHVTIDPCKKDSHERVAITNVHFLAFQIMPEYADSSFNALSPLHGNTKEENGFLHRKLVYGRKIKLLHLASNKYLSLPFITGSSIESKPAFVSDFNESCLFKMLPSGKARGEIIYDGDKFILESVQQKGHHVLCIKNSLTGSYELKLGIGHSVFKVHLQTSTDIHVTSKTIRGGYPIMLCNNEIDAYVGGIGSTVTDILPPAVSHDVQSKVGARKKRNILIPRPPPTSGDCWWQIEKWDDPLNGAPIEYGEKCRLKHLLTKNYLAVDEHLKLVLASTDQQGCHFDFVIKEEMNLTSESNYVQKEDYINLQYIHTDSDGNTHVMYLSLEDNEWEWMTEFAKAESFGSKWFNLSLKEGSDGEFLKCFKIIKILPANLHQLYFVESVKETLIKYMKKISTKPWLDELYETLTKVSDIMTNCAQVSQKTYTKMLRTTHVVDLLMGFLSFDDVDKKLDRLVCCVLKAFACVQSHRCHEYLAKESFIDVFFEKLATGAGVEEVLRTLVEDESGIAERLVTKLLKPDTLRKINQRLDAATVDLLSTLCFVGSKPERHLQSIICEEVISKDESNFFWTVAKGDKIYFFKGNKQDDQKPLNDLKGKDFDFFIAQLGLFSSVCKGINEECIKLVETWVPFAEALVVLTNRHDRQAIHPSIKSAYLNLVISVYLDRSIEKSGVDIDSIWHCYLWEKLSSPTTNMQLEPLQGANVTKNLVKDLEHSEEITKLLDIIIQDLENQVVVCVKDSTDKNAFLYQMLSAVEPLVNYGFRWNVDEESEFKLNALVKMLDGSTDLYSSEESLNSQLNRDYGKTERYKRKLEHQMVFQIKIKIIKILHIFFKQLVYLALEKFMYDFKHRRTNDILSPEDLIYAPNLLLSDNIEQDITKSYASSAQGKLRKFFSFRLYHCFDVQETRLVGILQDLMLYEDDELRASSAALLFDIYNKEHIMLEQAKMSYIVDGDRGLYDEMLRVGSFVDETRELKKLVQGVGDEEVAGLLEGLVGAMFVSEDETETATCGQNISFTTGVFSAIMKYVLKFCSSIGEDQIEVFAKACEYLQKMCRNNLKVQQRIMYYLTDLLKCSSTAVPSVAHLLTEVFTRAPSLCQQLSEYSIRQIYVLASSNSDTPQYLEYFTTLEAIIKPFKFSVTRKHIKINQEIISRLFSDNYQDIFNELLAKDNEDKRTEILETSGDDDIELLKLLYVTSLLATCCEGYHKFAEDMSQKIFSLNELVAILTNSNIPIERKVPFTRLLHEAYIATETDSIVSLHKLSISSTFWEHVSSCTQWLNSLPETIQDEEERQKIKYFLRKIFGYYMSYNEIVEIDEEIKRVCCILYYFTNGIGPLLISFCNEFATYKTNKVTLKEYERTIKPRGDTLREYGATIVALLNDSYHELFLSSPEQAEFWKLCLDSIDNVLPDSPHYDVITNNLTENYFLSEDFMEYRNSIKTEVETNRVFQLFVENYKKVYEWRKSQKEKEAFGELIPQGPSFLSLIELFDDFEVTVTEKDGEKQYVATANNIKCLLTMLNVLFRRSRHEMTCDDRGMLNRTLTMTLKVLIGIIHVRMNKYSNSMEEAYKKNVVCIQNALIEMKFPEGSMHHLPHPDDDIAVHVMSFLAILIFNGNESAQDRLCDLATDEINFFMRIHKLLTKLSLHFGFALKYVVERREPKKQEVKQEVKQEDIPLLERKDSRRSSVHIDEDGEQIQLIQTRKPLPKVTSFHEATDVTIFAEDDSPTSAYTEVYEVTSDDTINNRVSIVLDLVSAMCDGQNKRMQHILRLQENHITSYNIVGEISVLLQSLVEVPVMSNVPIINKIIQALIETCAGNFANQQVALNGQVIDSINIILKHNLETSDGITMQCKAVELLEVLLEETDENYTSILKAISKDLKIDHVIGYIKNMYEHYKHSHDNEEIERNMYRAYHVLRGMADNAGVPFIEYVGLSKEDIDCEVWKILNANTHRIEIDYITKEEKPLLTRVYFPFDSTRELSDDEKCILQNDINRDAPEDKVKDLLNWTESVLKKDKHKQILNKYLIVKAIMFASGFRHWLLIILTILLNLFVISFYKIPHFFNCTQSESLSSPLILPRPGSCWSSYQYIMIYLFGIPHLILAIWMVVEYFLKEAPNFKFGIPFIQEFLHEFVQNNQSWLSKLFDKKFLDLFQPPEDSQCFDIYFFSTYPLYRIFFFLCSFLGLVTYGYFYCFCLPYIFIKVEVINHVIKAVFGKAKQLFFVSLLIISLLIIYAVLSFAFMSSFFNPDSGHYCRTLWECFITTTREGLLDTFGAAIPATFGAADRSFNIYLWRSFFDLTFFIVITIVSLNVVTAILVDRFSELRSERDSALQDQKDNCFICGIPNDTFEREGIKGWGFKEHYKYDHNIYSYIYYALYIKSKCPQEFNAVEKYVDDMMSRKAIKFYPLRKAKVLGGVVATQDTKLISELKKLIAAPTSSV